MNDKSSSDNKSSVLNKNGASLNFPTLKEHLYFWIITVLGATADLWSKSAVFSWLQSRGEDYTVVEGFLSIVMRLNRGAAFSILEGKRWLLAILAISALLVMLASFIFGFIRGKYLTITMALFTAGVIGNLYDRLFNNGMVRDFIDVIYWPDKHWPAFNIADSMLCISVGLLLIHAIFFNKD